KQRGQQASSAFDGHEVTPRSKPFCGLAKSCCVRATFACVATGWPLDSAHRDDTKTQPAMRGVTSRGSNRQSTILGRAWGRRASSAAEIENGWRRSWGDQGGFGEPSRAATEPDQVLDGLTSALALTGFASCCSEASLRM